MRIAGSALASLPHLVLAILLCWFQASDLGSEAISALAPQAAQGLGQGQAQALAGAQEAHPAHAKPSLLRREPEALSSKSSAPASSESPQEEEEEERASSQNSENSENDDQSQLDGEDRIGQSEDQSAQERRPTSGSRKGPTTREDDQTDKKKKEEDTKPGFTRERLGKIGDESGYKGPCNITDYWEPQNAEISPPCMPQPPQREDFPDVGPQGKPAPPKPKPKVHTIRRCEAFPNTRYIAEKGQNEIRHLKLNKTAFFQYGSYMKSEEECFEMCRRHEQCQQVVWHKVAMACYPMKEATKKTWGPPGQYEPQFTSALCGVRACRVFDNWRKGNSGLPLERSDKKNKQRRKTKMFAPKYTSSRKSKRGKGSKAGKGHSKGGKSGKGSMDDDFYTEGDWPGSGTVNTSASAWWADKGKAEDDKNSTQSSSSSREVHGSPSKQILTLGSLPADQAWNVSRNSSLGGNSSSSSWWGQGSGAAYGADASQLAPVRQTFQGTHPLFESRFKAHAFRVGSWDDCQSVCIKHGLCKQAVYDKMNKLCEMWTGRSEDVDSDGLPGTNRMFRSAACGSRVCDVFPHRKKDSPKYYAPLRLNLTKDIPYGSKTWDWESCLAMCMNDYHCLQTVFDKRTRRCYPMAVAIAADVRLGGREEKHFNSAHCYLSDEDVNAV